MDNSSANGWIKHFADGTRYSATDLEVERRLKSWRNSRMENIMAVSATVKSVGTVVITGLGEYWQEDEYIAPMDFRGAVRGLLVKRRIMKKIIPEDKFLILVNSSSRLEAMFAPVGSGEVKVVPESWIGKWFVATIDVEKGGLEYNILER